MTRSKTKRNLIMASSRLLLHLMHFWDSRLPVSKCPLGYVLWCSSYAYYACVIHQSFVVLPSFWIGFDFRRGGSLFITLNLIFVKQNKTKYINLVPYKDSIIFFFFTNASRSVRWEKTSLISLLIFIKAGLSFKIK